MIEENESFRSFATKQGYVFVNEGVEDGDISSWDMQKINKGIAPRWAKKVTDVGKRSAQVAGSSSPSELAMRKVTDPNGSKEPYRESDLRRDQQAAVDMNARIASQLESLLDAYEEVEPNKDYVSVYTKAEDGQLDEFRVYSRGMRYVVKFVGHSSVFDRETQMCKSLKDVTNFINNKN